MQKYPLILAMIVLLGLSASPYAMAAQDDDTPAASQETEHAADVLDPPPLPKLDKGEWSSKKTVFSDALSAQDVDGNDLGKTLDLPGTTYSAHVEGAHAEDADEDPVYKITSAYEDALAAKYFSTRVKLPDSTTYLMGAAEDNQDGGIYGQSVIAQGKLRFIAVSDSGNGIEIFVSDEMPLPDLLQKISAKDKMETPGTK